MSNEGAFEERIRLLEERERAREEEIARLRRCNRDLVCLAALPAFEDEADTRALLSTILESASAEVRTVSNVGAGLEMLVRWRPDILLSDIGFPGEDGYSLIRKVRALEPERGGKVPAAALTAYASSEDRARVLEAGFHRHVPKPIDPNHLISVVAALVGEKMGA